MIIRYKISFLFPSCIRTPVCNSIIHKYCKIRIIELYFYIDDMNYVLLKISIRMQQSISIKKHIAIIESISTYLTYGCDYVVLGWLSSLAHNH